MQLKPSFVALLEDDTLDPATDLSNIAVREHADNRPYATSAYSPNVVYTDSWQQTSNDVQHCEDSTMAQGSWGSAELENDDFAVRNGGLVDGDIGGVGDDDFGDGIDGDVWDGFAMEDIEMEEVEDNKLVEDDSAVDNASRPGAGIGAGVRVGAAASVGGASRLPEGLAVKWQAARTQVKTLLTHCSLHCTISERFRLTLAYI